MTVEEAIKRIKARFDKWALDDEDTKAIQTLIPELHESEDERIRKALIDALKVSETIGELKFRLPYPTREECIAYLEKQQERNPINHNLTTWHRDVVYCAMCDENLDEGLRCNLEVVYKTIKELVDRTPVVEEQKPAEWSEEDEKIYDKALDALYYKDCNEKDDVIYALENLCDLIYRKRKRIPKYARWKPSEEQMAMLLAVINEPNNAGAESCRLALKSLYEHLKKLM